MKVRKQKKEIKKVKIRKKKENQMMIAKTVEEVEEEVYHDAVDEERGTRESSKDKGKEGDRSLGMHNLEKFYLEDLDEVQREKEEWQLPDDWRRICLQMVLSSRDLEINPVGCRFISNSVLITKGWL